MPVIDDLTGHGVVFQRPFKLRGDIGQLQELVEGRGIVEVRPGGLAATAGDEPVALVAGGRST